MLTWMYVLFALGGCGYVVVSAFLGHLFDAGDGDAGDGGHGDVDAEVHYGLDGSGHGTASTGGFGPAEFHFPFFSPLALATLLGSIGAYGLIARHGFEVSDGVSLLIAIPAALATAYGVTYLGWRIVSTSRASSVIRLAQLKGSRAEVTTPIPAGGLGEAVAMVGGHRWAAPARDAGGREVPRGAAVVVVDVVGSTLVVASGTKEGSVDNA